MTGKNTTSALKATAATGKKRAPLRFGLVGFGQHSRWAVLPAFKESRKARLVAVADISAEALAQVPDPKIATYLDYRRMFKQESLDAVYIATLVESHAEVAKAASRAGLHVITEKPMGTSVAECRQMINAAQKAQRLLAVDFETRFIPGNRQIRKWIADGLLGKVGAVHIDHFWDGHKTFGPLAARRANFCNSSGCLDCGVHKLDLVRFFCGGGEWRDIHAYGAWFGEAVRFPPHIAIQARLSTGVLVNVNVSFAFTAYIKPRIAGSNYYSLAIIGDKGVIVLHQATDGACQLQLIAERLQKAVAFEHYGHGPVITKLLDSFSAAAMTGKPLPPEVATGTDGLMAQYATDTANAMAVAAGDCSVAGTAVRQ